MSSEYDFVLSYKLFEMKYYFAPLQGYTDALFREIHAKHFNGIDAYYTPFCRMERGELRWHDQKDIMPERNIFLTDLNKLIPQIIANTAEEVDFLVPFLMEKGYRRIDMNFGCPFPMIAKKQKGAGILSCPDKVETVLLAMNKYKDCQFSVKMRLGMTDANECLQILPLLNDANLKQITMHARLGKDQYKGELDYDAFEKFYSQCKVPLVFNGDIVDVDSCAQITTKYPQLDGVMIGRGLLQNPFLVEEIINESVVPSAEKSKRLKKFVTDLADGYSNVMSGGDLQLVQKLSSYWEYLLPDLEHRLRKKILKSRKLSDYNSNVMEALSLYAKNE